MCKSTKKIGALLSFLKRQNGKGSWIARFAVEHALSCSHRLSALCSFACVASLARAGLDFGQVGRVNMGVSAA